MEPKFERSYGIIPLQKRGKEWHVFIIQHQLGHWGFPKGHPFPDEDPYFTARRELKEETGFIVKQLLVPDPISERYTCVKDGEQVNKRVTYFLAEVSGKEQLQTEEIKQGKWIPLQKVSENLTYPEAKQVAKEVIERIQ